MENTSTKAKKTAGGITIESSALLEHWQGHRRVTRRVIEAFPEEKLFTYSIGGMRPFSDLTMEMIGMAYPGIQAMATGEWKHLNELMQHSKKTIPKTKNQLLKLWDEVTTEIDNLWPQIPANRFLERDTAFGQWEGTVYSFLSYWIDNEIHHRGQGYVYLRSLGIEPPAFWQRD
jgi:uncharacterized damage-inducible protein DinB